MYREPEYDNKPITPRGGWKTGKSGVRYWSQKFTPDPDRVFDPKIGKWRALRENEISIPIPMEVQSTRWSRPTPVAPSTSDWGQMVQTRQPHLMSTADILREYFSGVNRYPGRKAELDSELQRRKVHDPEGLAIKWQLI